MVFCLYSQIAVSLRLANAKKNISIFLWGSVLVVEKTRQNRKRSIWIPFRGEQLWGHYNALLSETATGDTAGFLNFMPLHPDLLMDFKVSAS